MQEGQRGYLDFVHIATLHVGREFMAQKRKVEKA